MDTYEENMKNWWNQAVSINFTSKLYNVEDFLSGNTSLHETELTLLGDVSGKKILHLQCNFGQDTISLARLGATVVGVDISDKAIQKARELAKVANQGDITFVCCNIYDLPKNLQGVFDIVFTSYGVLCYLPELNGWATVIGHFLKPEGKFLIVEFHPFLGIFNGDFNKVEFEYFQSKAFTEKTMGTHAVGGASIEGTVLNWNHGMSEIISSLINSGIQIDQFEEYNFSHYNCFPNTKYHDKRPNVEEIEPGKFRLKHWGSKVPMMFSIVGVKVLK